VPYLSPKNQVGSNPELPIQRPVLDSFRNVLRPYLFLPGQVGNGARHLEDVCAAPSPALQCALRRVPAAAQRAMSGVLYFYFH